MNNSDQIKNQAEMESSNPRLKADKSQGAQTNNPAAGQDLGMSEERYRTILDAIEDGYYEVNLAGSFTFFNNSMCRILGYTPDEMMGLNYRQYMKAKEAASTFEIFNRVFTTGIPAKAHDWNIVKKDGSQAYAEASVSLMKDSDGAPIGFRGIARDITEQKKAREALRESEERYRTILETIEDGYYELDLTGRSTFYNYALCTILDIDPGDMLGIDYYSYMNEEDSARAFQIYNSVFRTGQPARSFNWKILKRDGSEVFLDTSVSLIRNSSGEPAGFRGITRDVTARKRAQEALQQSEAKYRLIAENISDIIWTTDADFIYTYISPSVKKLLGFTPEETLGQPLVRTSAPRYRSRIDEALAGVKMRAGRGEAVEPGVISLSPEEIYHNRKDGHRIWAETQANILYDEKGDFIGLIGSTRDISDRKRVELERQRLEDQLQRAQKMEAIGTLAGGVAHDLNNILSGIVSYPELLLLDLPEDSPLREPIMIIQESGLKAAAIVQDMLTLARRGVTVKHVVNLNDIISRYLHSPECVKMRSFHPLVRIKAELEPELLNVSGSPVHLSKAVMNLVSNAAEAMVDGGEAVIATSNLYLDKPVHGYETIPEGDYVMVRVSDSGIGIAPADRERIFEPFYTKKVMGRSGTGLGMAVVWGTIKDHKGYIDLHSVEGQSTTFTLYFPITDQAVEEEKQRFIMDDYRGRGERILIVDDVKEQREIAGKLLEKLGYRVSAVSGGEEAVQYLTNNRADLLLLDMIMAPGIDGLETYKRILELHPGQRAVIASGFSETDRVREAQSLGAGPYLKKPYTLEKIGIAVSTELKRKDR